MQSESMEWGVFKEMKVYSMRDGALAITCVKLPSKSDDEFLLAILRVRARLDDVQLEVKVTGGSVLTHLQHRNAEWSSKMSELGGSSDGCKIARTEERAISLKQLEVVANKVDSRCEAEAWPDKFNNTKHVPSTVNLYVVAEYIIKQATEADECSYVETVACAMPCLPLIALGWAVCQPFRSQMLAPAAPRKLASNARARRAVQAGFKCTSPPRRANWLLSPPLTYPLHSIISTIYLQPLPPPLDLHLIALNRTY